ncbi:3'-5' exonuclease [Arenibaculum pallidiluteum]|uniref:3'-5' exonuclease n=1 Tax=Arenibaculum pallidiluteum TaxID=2812559 RepID=UPI001A95DCB0|nr:3'-5' exonuclease [Arenibaculum pallidiluteum]
MHEDLEAAARRIEASGRYVVLRRFEPQRRYHEHDGCTTRTGLIIDTETTGLEAEDPIIQLALVEFRYGVECGRVFDVLGSWSWYEDPGRPIPPEVTRLTGITDAMVRGQRIDDDAVGAILSRASLVIAHNAGFDRPRAEERIPAFEDKPWACSHVEIPWSDEGIASTKLDYLAYRLGFFHAAHRAEDDCLALLHLLAQPLPESRRLALSALLERARRPTARVWALGSPYEHRALLKARGYRWCDGQRGRVKCWYRDVDEDEARAELDWLAREARCEAARSVTLTALTRHSERAFLL